MKIYILNVPKEAQPQNQPFPYPAHNKDYGIEQDFLRWLFNNPSLLTEDPDLADWHYLPIFYTRWHMHHQFGEEKIALQELQECANSCMLDDGKTFTITQFDGGTLLKLGKTIEFTAARTINQGIDIPILCSLHLKPFWPISKKYLATFNGSFSTHVIREEIREKFSNWPKVLVGGNLPTRFYKRILIGKQYNLNTLASYVALCPRGTSCNSFRFFEAMQFGIAPCLIGDRDVRPFSRFIDWDKISYYVKDTEELEILLSNLDLKEAVKKGKLAYQIWKKDLYYQKWCKYVIMELNALRE